MKTEGASVVEPQEAPNAPGLPAVPDSTSEADYSSEGPEEKVKVEVAEPAGVAAPPVSNPAVSERPQPDRTETAAEGDREHGDRRKRRSRRRSSEDRDDPREVRERRGERREREQLRRSPSVRDARPKDNPQDRGRAPNRNRPGSRKGSKGSRRDSKGRGKGKKGGKKGKGKHGDASRSSGHSSRATTGSWWPSHGWDSQEWDSYGWEYGWDPGWDPNWDYSWNWEESGQSPSWRTRQEAYSMVEDPEDAGQGRRESGGGQRPKEPEVPPRPKEPKPKKKLPMPREPTNPPPSPPKRDARTKEEKEATPPRGEPSRGSERRSGDRDRNERRGDRGDDPDRRDEGQGNRNTDGGRDRRKDEDRSRRGPPREEEKKNPAKKSKAGPPSGGDGGGGSGSGDSSYTYSYEEESEESEERVEDPSVRGSHAGSARSRRSQPGSARSSGGRRAPNSEASTARTSEIREMLQTAARKQLPERAKPALSQVKIEPFRGNREKYHDWKKLLDVQRALYRLEDSEMALLIYLSCEGEARQVLNQLEIADIQSDGGLQRVLRLLNDAFGARSDERFEQRQDAYLSYRRTPGTSVAAYIANLRRLREEYLREDEGTVISDRAFAQRMLSRAALTRRERMDVFFSAGGKYVSKHIERVLRFRCSDIHVQEKQQNATKPRGTGSSGYKKPFVKRPSQHHTKRTDRRGPYRPSRHTHIAENDEDEEDQDDVDDEDLEQEALMMNPDDEPEEYDDEEYGDEEEDYYEQYPYEEEDETGTTWELKEAFAAGWSAKSRAAGKKKARGYSEGPSSSKGGGKGKQRKEWRDPNERKKKSRCAACGQIGHWHSDPQCPKNGGASGTGGTSPSGANFASRNPDGDGNEPRVSRVNWTFVNGWDMVGDYESASDALLTSPDESSDSEVEPVTYGKAHAPSAKAAAAPPKSKYKVDLKKVLRALAVITEDEQALKKIEKRERRITREEEAAEKKRQEKVQRAHQRIQSFQSTDAGAQEMLTMLPYLDKEEKRQLYQALKREQEEEELRHFRHDYDRETVRRSADRKGGYSAAKAAPRPSTAASDARGSAEPPPARSENQMPEPVRRKKLKEFRWHLYEASLDHKGRCKPSEASDFPTKREQETCKHPFERLAWGANGEAHWASCRACGLKKVLYYSRVHGALAAEAHQVEEDVHATYVINSDDIILDTGCRTAVAGEEWHHRFQQMLDAKGLRYETVEHEEIFRFGAGKPVLSTEAVVYPVQLGADGPLSYLRLAVVRRTRDDDRVAHCPALVSPI